MQGIYSWVSPVVREQIRGFIFKKLRLGGVVMIGYYDPFSFALIDALRPLIYHYAKDLGNLKSPEENIQSSLGFVKDLLDLPVLESFKSVQLQNQFNHLSNDAKYLLHE